MADTAKQHKTGLKLPGKGIKQLLNFHKKNHSRPSNIPQAPAKASIPAPSDTVSKVPRPPAQPANTAESILSTRTEASEAVAEDIDAELQHTAAEYTASKQTVHEEIAVAKEVAESPTVVNIDVKAGAHVEEHAELPAHPGKRQQQPQGRTTRKPSAARSTVASEARAAAARATRQAATTQVSGMKAPRTAVPPKVTTRSRVGALDPVFEGPARAPVPAGPTEDPLTPRSRARTEARATSGIPAGSAAHITGTSTHSPTAKGVIRSAAAAAAASPKRRYGYGVQPGVESVETPTKTTQLSRLNPNNPSSAPNTPQKHTSNTPRSKAAQGPPHWRPSGPPTGTPRNATGTPRGSTGASTGTWGRPSVLQQHSRSSSVAAVAPRQRTGAQAHTRFASSACVTTTVDPFMFTGAFKPAGWDGSPTSSISDLPSYMAPTASSRRRVETAQKEKHEHRKPDEELENYVVEKPNDQIAPWSPPPLPSREAHREPGTPTRGPARDPAAYAHRDDSIWAAALENLGSPRSTASPRVAASARTSHLQKKFIPIDEIPDYSSNAYDASLQHEFAVSSPRVSNVASLLTLSAKVQEKGEDSGSPQRSPHRSPTGPPRGPFAEGVEGEYDDGAMSPYLAPSSRRAAYHDRPELHSSGDNSSSAASTPISSRLGQVGTPGARYSVHGEPYVIPPSPLRPKLHINTTNETSAETSNLEGSIGGPSEGPSDVKGPSVVDNFLEEQCDTPRSDVSAKLAKRWPQLVLNQDALAAEPSSPVSRVLPRFAAK